MALANKQWFRLHGWLGVQAGFLLFVICLSGTLATLSQELDWLVDQAARNPAPATADTPVADLQTLYRAARRHAPRADVTAIRVPPEPYLPAQVQLTDAAGSQLLYLDRFSGEFLAERSQASLKVFLRIFHKQFFLVDSPYSFHGLYIVGLFGFFLLLSVISGLMFLKSWLKKLLRLHWHRGLRVFLADWHRSTGLWALLFSLLFALTGIWYWAEKVAGITDVELVDDTRMEMQDHGDTLPQPDMALYLRQAQRAIPGIAVSTLRMPGGDNDPVHLFGQTDALLVRDAANYVALDPYSGALLASRSAQDMGLLQRWIHTVDPLHFGNFGGLWLKALWFLFGLLITLSVPVGAALWYQRMRAGALRRRAPRATPLALSNLATVLVLAAATASSLAGMQRVLPTAAAPAASLGSAAIGPWTTQIGLHVNAAGRATRLQLFFAQGKPRLHNATVEIDTASGVDSRPLRGAWRHLGADISGTGTGWPQLTVVLQDQSGNRYEHTLQRHDLRAAAATIDPAAATTAHYPAAAPLAYAFLATLWLALGGWLWLQLGAARRAHTALAPVTVPRRA